jgi:glyoxylase-like metal-dependent hydrolase (beta-lactamase superfamily II)
MSIFLAGDTSYTQQLLLDGVVDGVSESDEAAKQTIGCIQTYLATVPAIYLPSHDPESVVRLENRSVVSVASDKIPVTQIQ